MTVNEIFETMDYGTAPESAAEALAWLVDQGDRFGHFIDGTFTATGRRVRDPQPGHRRGAGRDHPSHAGRCRRRRRRRPQGASRNGPGSRRAWPGASTSTPSRGSLQKHGRLFAVLETLDNGKPIRESRDIDVPLAQRHFYYHAGMAQLMESELPDREALGVCGQIIPWNFPLLMLAWKIAPGAGDGQYRGAETRRIHARSPRFSLPTSAARRGCPRAWSTSSPATVPWAR